MASTKTQTTTKETTRPQRKSGAAKAKDNRLDEEFQIGEDSSKNDFPAFNHISKDFEILFDDIEPQDVEDLALYRLQDEFVDGVAQNYRSCLAAALCSDQPNKHEVVQHLRLAMERYFHKQVNWPPVRNQVVQWHSSFRNASEKQFERPKEIFFDINGHERPRNDEKLENFDFDSDVVMEEAPTLPDDPSIADELYQEGTQLLSEALEKLKLNPSVPPSTTTEAVDDLNNRIMRVNEKEYGDKPGHITAIPYQDIILSIPRWVKQEAIKVSGRGGYEDWQTEFKAVTKATGQHLSWCSMAEETAVQIAKKMIKDHALARDPYWKIMREWLNKSGTEQQHVPPIVSEQGKQPTVEQTVSLDSENTTRTPASEKPGMTVDTHPNHAYYNKKFCPIIAYRQQGRNRQVFAQLAESAKFIVCVIIGTSHVGAGTNVESFPKVGPSQARVDREMSNANFTIYGVADSHIRPNHTYKRLPDRYVQCSVSGGEKTWLSYTTVARQLTRPYLDLQLKTVYEDCSTETFYKQACDINTSVKKLLEARGGVESNTAEQKYTAAPKQQSTSQASVTKEQSMATENSSPAATTASSSSRDQKLADLQNMMAQIQKQMAELQKS